MPEPRSEQIAGFPCLVADGEGTRPFPLLLLHGAWSHHGHLHGFAHALSDQGFAVYAPSRRGRHGVGPERGTGLGLQDQVDDTRAVLDALPQQPALIGHDLGALIALQLAAEGRCRAAALLAPAPLPGGAPTFQAALLRTSLGMAVRRGRPCKPPRWAANEFLFEGVPEGDRERVYGELVHESGRALSEARAGLEITSPEVPVVVMAGNHDPLCPPDAARALAERYDLAMLEYENFAHWMVGETGWELMAAEAMTWLLGATGG